MEFRILGPLEVVSDGHALDLGAAKQRALLAVALLAIAGGLLGAWVVLRRLAFFVHAAGSATFPGLVVAGPWGLAPAVAALGAGLCFAGLLSRLTRRTDTSSDAATGLLLAAVPPPAARVRALPGRPHRKLTTGVRSGADGDPAIRAFRKALSQAIRSITVNPATGTRTAG